MNHVGASVACIHSRFTSIRTSRIREYTHVSSNVSRDCILEHVRMYVKYRPPSPRILLHSLVRVERGDKCRNSLGSFSTAHSRSRVRSRHKGVCCDSNRGHKRRLSPIVLCRPIFPVPLVRATITDSSVPLLRGSRIKPRNFSCRYQ